MGVWYSWKTGRGMVARSIERRSIACRWTVIRGAGASGAPFQGSSAVVVDLPVLGAQAQGHQLVHQGWILVDSQPTLVEPSGSCARECIHRVCCR